MLWSPYSVVTPRRPARQSRSHHISLLGIPPKPDRPDPKELLCRQPICYLRQAGGIPRATRGLLPADPCCLLGFKDARLKGIESEEAFVLVAIQRVEKAPALLRRVPAERPGPLLTWPTPRTHSPRRAVRPRGATRLRRESPCSVADPETTASSPIFCPRACPPTGPRSQKSAPHRKCSRRASRGNSPRRGLSLGKIGQHTSGGRTSLRG